jgi:hypothetical protein
MTDGLARQPVPRAPRHVILADLDGPLCRLFSMTFGKNAVYDDRLPTGELAGLWRFACSWETDSATSRSASLRTGVVRIGLPA